ncbi:hypothetical protein FHS34_002024 [Streptomyces echinatus]|uniref:Uncharacterized protein n=1 Tax=Streptomyces echinatus TaxID=67293 RepID=A0A7W9UPP0_9ACTN|nr:hypothetical protein [Streptomyces echinatus]
MKLLPADLVTFYVCTGDVIWTDVGNGYFTSP